MKIIKIITSTYLAQLIAQEGAEADVAQCHKLINRLAEYVYEGSTFILSGETLYVNTRGVAKGKITLSNYPAAVQAQIIDVVYPAML